MHGHVIRPYSHSLSDDEKLYRPSPSASRKCERDPITRFQLFLVREGILDEKGIDELEKDVEAEIQEASDRAVRRHCPRPTRTNNSCTRPTSIPHRRRFRPKPCIPRRQTRATANPEKTMADLINACLKDEMKRDPRIVMFGEDVADCSREEYLQGQASERQGRRLQADGWTADASLAATASSTRRWRRPIL